ncbi:MAG: hypothetical protein ACLFPE_01485 [Bacteroidales bacterium]
MAEIKIEKKKTVWPWVLLALIIVAILIYFLATPDGDDDREEVTETTTIVGTEESDLQDVEERNQEVMAYVSWIDTSSYRMGLDHEYSHEAITKLTNAVQAMADEIGYDVRTELGHAKAYADSITRNPYKTSHADMIRRAADMISMALANMQAAHYPGLNAEARDVENAADDIKPGELTLDQKEQVKNFYREAAALLEKMN